MRLQLFLSILLAGAATLAGCARDTRTASNDFVTVEPQDVTPKITRYADEDRDGVVTRKEAKADPALAASFDRYDLDKNDKLDRGEFARMEDATRQRAASQHASASDRWLSEDGYFGPEGHRYSLNRSGGDQSRAESE
jgi:hypothetical protein